MWIKLLDQSLIYFFATFYFPSDMHTSVFRFNSLFFDHDSEKLLNGKLCDNYAFQTMGYITFCLLTNQ